MRIINMLSESELEEFSSKYFEEEYSHVLSGEWIMSTPPKEAQTFEKLPKEMKKQYSREYADLMLNSILSLTKEDYVNIWGCTYPIISNAIDKY